MVGENSQPLHKELSKDKEFSIAMLAMVCLVESWLCDDISDNEIKIPSYQLHCLDRNRHGGGVLMYASEQLIVNPLPLCGSNLELLLLSVELLHQRICISIFYRPPSSHIDSQLSFVSLIKY